MLADVIGYWKKTSFQALDGVTPFLRLKDVTNTCKRMRRRWQNRLDYEGFDRIFNLFVC